MVSTRSSTNTNKGQAKLEDFNAGSMSTTVTATSKKKSTNEPKAQSKGRKRKEPQEQLEVEPDPPSPAPSAPPRPSAANAAAIKGNSTVSPSLPEASKRRKPNAASLVPQQDPERGGGAEGNGERKLKPKSGGRNVGGEAKRAVARQQARVARVGRDGEAEEVGEDGEDVEGQEGPAEGKDGSKAEKPIMINRSPVLQLCGACVAEFLFGEEVGWEACLSMGAAIAALCAVSKGKAIGKIEPKEQIDEQAAKNEDRKKKALQGPEEYRVLGFSLHVKNGKAQVSGAPKNVSEGQLVGKFGGQDNYDGARAAMRRALESWKAHSDELDKKAFGMYENFRPSVPSGGGGWGKKGELNLAQVESAVERS